MRPISSQLRQIPTRLGETGLAGMGLFGHRTRTRPVPPAPGARPMEGRQVALLELLRQRQGAVVSFAELYDAGVEFPASVVSELELVGVPVERRPVQAGGVRRPGVRLDPSCELGRANHVRIEDESAPSVGGGLRARRLAARWSALAALSLVLAAITASLVGALTSGGARPPRRADRRTIAPSPTARRGVPVAPPSQGPVTRLPAPEPALPALAAELEAEGHQLLQVGRYGEATRVLARSVAATGRQLADCLQPVTETCLTYAYALYDLGRALQLGGEASSAVPILQRRLQIDNQRGIVAAALKRATVELNERGSHARKSR